MVTYALKLLAQNSLQSFNTSFFKKKYFMSTFNSIKIPLNVTHWTYQLQVSVFFCFLRIAPPGEIMFCILEEHCAFTKHFSFLWFNTSTLREKHHM